MSIVFDTGFGAAAGALVAQFAKKVSTEQGVVVGAFAGAVYSLLRSRALSSPSASAQPATLVSNLTPREIAWELYSDPVQSAAVESPYNYGNFAPGMFQTTDTSLPDVQ